MAQRIRATRFFKRINSLAVPEDWTREFMCNLKEDCSWNNPIFLLKTDDFQENYVNWGQWYYYVTDVVFKRNDLTEVHCKVDSLGTFRWHILESSQFVAYNDSTNTEIVDTRLSIKTSASVQENISEYTGDHLGRGRVVIVNAASENQTSTYVVSTDNALRLLRTMENFIETVLPDTDSGYPEFSWFDVAGAIQGLGEVITKGMRQALSSGKVVDSIKSSYILPLDYLTTGTTVKLGRFDTGIPGCLLNINSRIVNDGTFLRIPWQATDWRRNAPYTEIYANIPYVGLINIPPATVMGSDVISTNYAIDMATGDTVCVVSAAPPSAGLYQHIIGVYSVNLAGSFPLGATDVNPMQLATSLIMAGGTVAATIATGGVAGAIAAGTAGIIGTANNMNPNPSTVITGGGAAFGGLNDNKMHVMTVFHDTNVAPDYNSRIIGQPYMKIAKLDHLDGYVECRNAHIGINGHYNEAKEIESFLNSGIYIEGEHNG